MIYKHANFFPHIFKHDKKVKKRVSVTRQHVVTLDVSSHTRTVIVCRFLFGISFTDVSPQKLHGKNGNKLKQLD